MILRSPLSRPSMFLSFNYTKLFFMIKSLGRTRTIVNVIINPCASLVDVKPLDIKMEAVLRKHDVESRLGIMCP